MKERVLKFLFLVRSKKTGIGVKVYAFDKDHAKNIAVSQFPHDSITDLKAYKL